MAPQVSVVIDNHNYGRYLGQAIESVLKQDFEGTVECIVVDDGSTDESRAVIASFGDKIRPILQKKQGQATAFNNGFAAARGEFVCLLDSDDYWSADKLKKVIGRFEDPGVGVVQHYLRDVGSQTALLKHPIPSWPETYRIEDYLDARIHFTATSGLAFRRSFLERALPIPKEIFYYLDDLLSIKVLSLSRAANVPEFLGFHRIHGQNFCAGGYWDLKKLERDMRMRALLNAEIGPWLERRGLRRTKRSLEIEELEYFRRRILLHMFKGERSRAAGEWLAMFKRYGGRRFGLFRAATCLLALLSPRLYLKFYEAYNRLGILPHLRFRLFPE